MEHEGRFLICSLNVEDKRLFISIQLQLERFPFNKVFHLLHVYVASKNYQKIRNIGFCKDWRVKALSSNEYTDILTLKTTNSLRDWTSWRQLSHEGGAFANGVLKFYKSF